MADSHCPLSQTCDLDLTMTFDLSVENTVFYYYLAKLQENRRIKTKRKNSCVKLYSKCMFLIWGLYLHLETQNTLVE